MSARGWLAACTLGILLACSGEPSAEECARPARELVKDLQAYVDGFADVAPENFARKEMLPSAAEVASAIARYRQASRGSRCSAAVRKTSIAAELGALRGRGVIAQTIATTLRARLAGLEGLGDVAPSPEVRGVAPGEDLASVVAGVVPGSTVMLAPGEFTLSRPLVLLDSVSLIGSGKARSRIVSSAPGVAVLFVGTGTLRLEELTLAHAGREAASLVIVRSGSYLIRGARLSDATKGSKGDGGIGLLVGASEPAASPTPSPPTPTLLTPTTSTARTMLIEDSDFVDNITSGITVGGSDAPTMVGVSVSGSKGCGICYLGKARGELRASTVASNAVGVSVFDAAAPVLRENRITSNRIGVQVRDRATPTIIGNELMRNTQAAMVFVGKSRGRARANVCGRTELGVILLDTSRPALTSNRCLLIDQRK